MAIKVSIDGVIFKSILAAARKHNLSHKATVNRIKSPDFPEWKLVGETAVSCVRLLSRIAKYAVVVWVGKRKFPTMTAASERYGISLSSIRNRCQSKNWPDWKLEFCTAGSKEKQETILSATIRQDGKARSELTWIDVARAIK